MDRVSAIKIYYIIIITFLGVQRYENMNTAHGAGWGKWVFGIANSATTLFSKIWACIVK